MRWRHGAVALFATLVMSAVPAPADAHHSFSAEFDINQPVTLAGTIAEVRWSNPHAWLYIDVKEADGKVVRWAIEMVAANQLYRRGWRREHVVIGTPVTVEGWRARNGSNTVNAGTMKLANGTELFEGQAPAR